jgi:hypothetical protein
VGKKGLDEFVETLTKKRNSCTAKLVEMNATALLPQLLPPCNPASPLLTALPLCQHCHPAPAANTVLQMPCFRRAAAVLLLLMLPDEQTETQT